MSVRIEMPQLSAEGESATLATWLVAVGDEVEKGDVIAELETDKSTVELEAPASGKILELAIEAGSEGIAPGVVLGTIASRDDASAVSSPEAGKSAKSSAIDAAAPPTAAPEPAAPARAAAPTPATPSATPSAAAAEGRHATPLARRAAAANEVDLGSVRGSGPRGRVVEADVIRLAEAGEAAVPPAAEAVEAANGTAPAASSDAPASNALDVQLVADAAGFTSTRLSAMRKTIARRMTESKQHVPHFYLRMRVAMDEVMAVRARLNTRLAEEGREVKISVNDFILRASALALRDVPAANVQFAGDVMHVFDRVDVSVAVATEGGLVTPVVRDADRKGLVALAEEVKSLALQARGGNLAPEQYQGGTFTISNLGMYGIETVYPILNPPQACILGVGAAEEQPVVRGGEIVIGRIAALTLAADHRVVDGAVGAQLLAAIRTRLEDPMGMML